MVAHLHQRAQALAVNPGNIEAVDAIAAEIRQLDRDHLPAEQQAQIDESFFFLAQARQWLEYQPHQPHLAGRVDEVPPPRPFIEEQLIEPLPRLLMILRGLAIGGSQRPAATQQPVQQDRPNSVSASTPTRSQVNLVERIWAIVSKILTAILNFLNTYLCCATRRVQTTVSPPAQCPPERVEAIPPQEAPAGNVQQQVQPPPQQELAPPPQQQAQQAQVGVQILAADIPQPVGHLLGTLNTAAVGGPAVATNCVNELLVQLWDALGRRENLSTPGLAAQLIDTSLRVGAPKAEYPRIEGVPLQRLGEHQNYKQQIQALELHAYRNPQGMIGAILSKGHDRHLLLIDGRDRRNYRYYHYDPRGNGGAAYLEISDSSPAFVAHLNGAVPIEEANPFALRAFMVNGAQA